MHRLICILLYSALAATMSAAAPWDRGPLRVSSDGRYLQHADGTPFFWLADTAWLMTQKLNRDEVKTYLENRRAKGFNVVQCCLVQFFHDKNFNGSPALIDRDLARLNVTPGNDPADPAQYDYWDHVDYIVETAAANGIYVAMTPMWRYSPLPAAAQAVRYIEQLTARYRSRPNIIWVNGGSSRGGDDLDYWNAAGAALKRHAPDHLVTFHPFGRMQSSSWFHQAPWLDFNMFVSGHRRYDQDTQGKAYGEDNWRYVLEDLAKTPRKPTLDGESSFENTPQGLHDPTQPYWGAADVRRYAWWSVFAGAAGHTYGENSVRQVYLPTDRKGESGAKGFFLERLEAEGATQMKHVKNFILSRPVAGRVNDQSLVAGDEGEKYQRILVTRGPGWIAAYNYTGRNFTLRLNGSAGARFNASWFNPRTGEVTAVGSHPGTGTLSFNPPGEPAPGNDWVLVLDEVAKK
jgi:hypothetical protein